MVMTDTRHRFRIWPDARVGASTFDHVIAKARAALLIHIERLLEANQKICKQRLRPRSSGDAVLLAAIDLPDDLRIHISMLHNTCVMPARINR
jgi:hypothetical protein